jgi:hypothetical protein
MDDLISNDAADQSNLAHEVLPTADDAALTLAETTLAVEHASERVRTAQANQIAARTALAIAIENWRGAFPKLTPLENARQFQAAALAERARQVDAPAPLPRPCADSAVDSQAMYSKGGKPTARYGAFRRGGFDVSRFGQRIKLPSQK